MPTYVYECKKCEYRFEVLQSIADPPRKRCPKCRSAVRRVLMPGGGLIFRGTGFYITDYKHKEPRQMREREEGKKRERDEGSNSEGKSTKKKADKD